MNDAIQKLVDAVQKAAPVVWQAAYRQAYINGVENTLLVIIFFSLGLFLVRVSKWSAVKSGYDGEPDWTEPGPIIAAIGAVGSFLLMIPCTVEALDCFLNPAFAAIKNLKGLL